MFSNLQVLSVGENQLSGIVPESIGQLKRLEKLDISGNSLEGVISEAHFTKLSKLYYLDLSSNLLKLNMGPNWIPPFQLNTISLGSHKLGPHFPKWLQSHNKYSYLDNSNAKIVSDYIPNWFWDLPRGLSYLSISNNQISGRIPNSSIATCMLVSLSYIVQSYVF